jgi:signal transduction histidine kinase
MGSRARRLLVMTDAERKRLERALHDGAQQRLVAASTTLGLAQRRLEAGDEGAGELVAEAVAELGRCAEDLRDLARHIYPAVLAERGLESALGDLAHRAAGPVEVEAALPERLPEAVELTAYLVVAEALEGLEDAEATVRASVVEGSLVLEVRGASVGGEQLSRFRERAEALDGSIESSSDGVGGSLRVVLPIG